MLSKLTLFTFATLLLLFAAANVHACGMSGVGGGSSDAALVGMAIGALITLPVWLPLLIIHKGVKLTGKAISKGVDKISTAIASPPAPTRNRDFWRKRIQSEELKEYFLKTEKDPNVSNLLACALHFELAEDWTSARNFLRRSLEAAKKDPNWETNAQVLLSSRWLSTNKLSSCSASTSTAKPSSTCKNANAS